MSEQEDALSDLSEAGVLISIRWAWDSACLRLAEDYDPATGHTASWLGYTAHTLLTDRLDRVFSCGNYSVQTPEDDESGLDVLMEGLLPGEAEKLLRLRSNVVERADRTLSPGWRFGPWIWLLSSFPAGGVNKIDWRRKSSTKQRVAGESSPDYYDLFTDFEAVFEATNAKRSTLIVAHSYDGDVDRRELFLGSPKIDPNSGSPWNWLVDLLSGPPSSGGRIFPSWPNLPTPPEAGDVADAPVRLKPRRGEQRQKDGK